MIAIWPAGPPKLTKPSWSQNRSASRKLTVAGREVGPWEEGSVVCAVTLGPLLEDHRSCARRCFHCTQEPFLFRGNLPSSLATPAALQASWVRPLLRRESGLLLWSWTVAVRASLRCQKLAAAPEATLKSGLFSSVRVCRGSASLLARTSCTSPVSAWIGRKQLCLSEKNAPPGHADLVLIRTAPACRPCWRTYGTGAGAGRASTSLRSCAPPSCEAAHIVLPTCSATPASLDAPLAHRVCRRARAARSRRQRSFCAAGRPRLCGNECMLQRCLRAAGST